jgi:hypothetical protein
MNAFTGYLIGSRIQETLGLGGPVQGGEGLYLLDVTMPVQTIHRLGTISGWTPS